MALGPQLSQRIVQRLGQSLVMTPQLQQAIKLLQMSNIEAAEFVDGELEQNPMLERDDGVSDDGLDEPVAEASADDGEWDDQTAPETDALDSIDFESRPGDAEIPDEAGYDVDYDNIYNNAGETTPGPAEPMGLPEPQLGAAPSTSGGGGFENDLPGLEERFAEGITLRDHLNRQIMVELPDPESRIVAGYLVECLDETGYLSMALDDIAEALDCPTDFVEAVLSRCQQFDPAGLFARGLAECLKLQLMDRNRYDPAIAAVLDNLDLLANREFTKLAKLAGVDVEDVAEMIDEIRSLDPKPALSFMFEPVQPILPDVLMRRHPSGGWLIDLNPETLPRVLVNNAYHARIKHLAQTKDERNYIAEQLQSANWLVKALHQRATTILKVATEIVAQQDGFFRHGVQHLKPLVLRDIAEAVEMHESTVSRVTANKYIATPRGIYELKYFFTSAIASSTGGEAVSAEAVRQRIKELIDAEDPKKVLSDDKIAAILKKEGMDAARRTVAKYRESLGLGSSVERRRAKAEPR